MRRGEKSKIMIKPRWGYGRESDQDTLVFPEGWTSEEQKKILKSRRIFFEVKLYDWIVRHDLDGDGMLLKTMHTKGVGYDRPFEFDELTVDIKAY